MSVSVSKGSRGFLCLIGKILRLFLKSSFISALMGLCIREKCKEDGTKSCLYM